jgi:undecaprenyl phosphate-alpha-L-ara4N flippase subunit ArnE
MKNHQILMCLLTVLFLSFGQVLFKYASTKIDTEKEGLLFSLLFNPTFCLALIIYSLATVTWLLVL